MRHSAKAHCAGKGPATDKETKDTSGAVPKRIPPLGGREVEELRQLCGAVARTRRTSAPALQMARPAGSGRDRGESPPQNSREATLRKEVNQLKRLLAEKTVEVDFLKGALQKIEARRQGAETLARRHL